MEVIDERQLASAGALPPSPVCVFLTPAAEHRLDELAGALGADPTHTEQQLRRRSHRRPFAHVDGQRISVVALDSSELEPQAELHLYVGERGLLVLGPETMSGMIRAAVEPVEAPRDALVAVLLALAYRSEDTIQRLSEVALALDQGSSGLASGAQRREMSRARAQLFALQQVWSAHRQMMSPDDPLAEVLTDGHRRALRRARGVFETSATMATQLYALLGDTLDRQSTVINERLTLVAVVFFPLTVSTGFFGMNFEWMTSNIGSAWAFVLLGILLPLVLVAVTLVGARWLTRE